ncbi:MAG: hypothetical protein MJ223_02605 [Mycoplasmoidaceae bacterium]|nr:hypothetical protein [Mycoplasmoidaceae bacterium]
MAMVLNKDYSIRITNKSFAFSKNGKPILNNKKLHVSLSHSNSMIAVAVSDFDVGVDIEKVVNKTMAKTLSKALHVKNDCLEVTSK